MVARDCSIQDIPYSCMLQETDEEREFLNCAWDEFKSHQLTDLSNISNSCNDIELLRGDQNDVYNSDRTSTATSATTISQHHPDPGNVYYDLNSQQRTE